MRQPGPATTSPRAGPGHKNPPSPAAGALTWMSVHSVGSSAQGFSSKHGVGSFTPIVDHKSLGTQGPRADLETLKTVKIPVQCFLEPALTVEMGSEKGPLHQISTWNSPWSLANRPCPAPMSGELG